MPIRPLFAGRGFDPETITEMGVAVERTCAAMGVRDINDMTTELVAEKIIQLADRGVAGVDALSSMAVRELTDLD